MSHPGPVARVKGELTAALAATALALTLGACGGATKTPRTTVVVRAAATARTTTTTAPPPKPKPPPAPPYPQLLSNAVRTGTIPFLPAVRWQGRTAAWIARSSSGVTLMSFDQRLLTLHLHSGTVDAGTLGWRYGPSVGGVELTHLAAAFNGGFRLSVGAGGFEAYGHVGAPLQSGLGSIVTYSDGTTDIGSWHQGVPAPGKQVVSVRQNLSLLIDHGTASSNAGCDSCWGATLGGVSAPARSALGITADGRLIWAGGEGLAVSELASALLSAHVVRAVELDINPEWVNGYLYGHRGGHGPLAPISVVPGQNGIPGEYLSPWSRDFFTVVGR